MFPVARRESGFTLIEIMVVLVIIAILSALIGPQILGRVDEARVTAARQDIQTLGTALDFYRMDNFSYPTTDQGLTALVQKPDDPSVRNWRPEGYLRRAANPRIPGATSTATCSPAVTAAPTISIRWAPTANPAAKAPMRTSAAGISSNALWGHRATLARDGREGLDLMTTHRYDLVLMDMQMPEMGGLEATRRFRAQETGKRTPIVAMTANAMEGDRESCLAAGMDDYLPKPMRSAELLAVLERHAPVREINAGFDYAAALASEDREILEVVAQPFIDSFCRDITTLRNALAGGDRDTLRRTAHSIKGNSAMFGFEELERFAKGKNYL